MWEWIIIVVCYLIGAGFFRLLGGLGSASEALQGWGRHTTSVGGTASPTTPPTGVGERAALTLRRCALPGWPVRWR
jgi:hypothetical protein